MQINEFLFEKEVLIIDTCEGDFQQQTAVV